MRRIRILMVAAVFILAYAVAAQAQAVTASLKNDSVKRGKRVSGQIVLTIPKGLHVNSHVPSSPYLIATTAKVSGRGLRVSGPTFPPGHDRKFGFSEEPINVYEGRVVFPFSVRVPSRHGRGSVSLAVNVKFQACTEEVCYAPRETTITLKLVVR